MWLGELLSYRQLLVSLTWRDVRVRYKQSVLGLTWAVIVPVGMMLVFTMVLGGHVGAAGTQGAPYPLYALCGLLPWTFFSSSLSGCVQSLVANRNLVTKIYFPREVFPLSCIGSALVDFLPGAAALGGLAAWYAWGGTWSAPPWWSLTALPLLLLIQMCLTAGLGMLLAASNLFFRDVRPMVGVALPLWMFTSGVVIPPPARESWAGWILAWNPMLPLIEGFRLCVVHGRWPTGGELLYSGVTAAVMLLFGWTLFRRCAPRFAECI